MDSIFSEGTPLIEWDGENILLEGEIVGTLKKTTDGYVVTRGPVCNMGNIRLEEELKIITLMPPTSDPKEAVQRFLKVLLKVLSDRVKVLEEEIKDHHFIIHAMVK